MMNEVLLDAVVLSTRDNMVIVRTTEQPYAVVKIKTLKQAVFKKNDKVRVYGKLAAFCKKMYADKVIYETVIEENFIELRR